MDEATEISQIAVPPPKGEERQPFAKRAELISSRQHVVFIDFKPKESAMRNDGRTSAQIRPIRFVPNFTKNPAGSVLVEVGHTMVLCTVKCPARCTSLASSSEIPTRLVNC